MLSSQIPVASGTHPLATPHTRPLFTLHDFLPHVANPERLHLDARIIYQTEVQRCADTIIDAVINEIMAVERRRILLIGIGTGYMVALLAHYFDQAVALERDEIKVQQARRKLASLNLNNVDFEVGDGICGIEGEEPFDVIFLNARVNRVPDCLYQQISDNGRIIAFTGANRNNQLLQSFRHSPEGVVSDVIGSVRFVTQIGQILVELGDLTEETEAQISTLAGDNSQRYLTLLRERTKISESDLCYALARQNNLKWLPIQELESRMDKAFDYPMSERFLKEQEIVPITQSDGEMSIATTNPDLEVDDLAYAMHLHSIDIFLVTQSGFRRLWRHYQRGVDRSASLHSEMVESLIDSVDGREFAQRESVPTEEQSRVEQMLHHILTQSLDDKASDVHFEKLHNGNRIRIRINGDLREVSRPIVTNSDYEKLVNVLKVKARLDITEHRLPQGGRFLEKIDNQLCQFRVQTQPVYQGENAILRLIPRFNSVPSLTELGFSRKLQSLYTNVLERPGGLVLVTGPTGSGKTTTLYAALDVLSSDHQRKVISIEDPIEGLFHGIQQTNLGDSSGQGFANALKHIVRQDPDVIVVGEIRDPVTALETVRASQTGHLVLATLHSNGSVDAVQRLVDLELKTNSISSDLLAVLSQRLVRKVCFNCREEVEPDPAMLDLLRCTATEIPVATRGAGCIRCGQTGVSGRVAAIEYLQSGPAFRRAVHDQANIDELYSAAAKGLFVPITESFIALVKQGLVPLSEAPRVVGWVNPSLAG